MLMLSLASIYAVVSGALKLVALILVILACIKYLRSR